MDAGQPLEFSMCVRDSPVPQPLVSAVVVAGVAAAAAGSGGGRTEGHQEATCQIQEAASWGWISAESALQKAGSW